MLLSKKIPSPEAAASNSPCLHSSSLSHSTMPDASQQAERFRKRERRRAQGGRARGGSPGSPAGHPSPAPSHRNTGKELIPLLRSATGPPRLTQGAAGVRWELLGPSHEVPLHPLKLRKYNLRAERAAFYISNSFTESKLFKVKVYLYSL